MTRNCSGAPNAIFIQETGNTSICGIAFEYVLTLIFIGLAILPLIIVGGVVLQTTDVAAKGQAMVLESQIAQNAASKVTNYLLWVESKPI
jgi:hypothetical protein